MVDPRPQHARPAAAPPDGDAAGGWSHFPHGADVGVRGQGATLGEAFANAALALTAVVADPGSVVPLRSVAILCSAPDHELLLVEWLNQIVFEMATRRMLFSRFDVHVDGCSLRAQAFGEPIDRLRHAPRVEAKGATLTALRVAQDADGRWLAQCVVDV
jgi:SHS2 domain-containing protein